jgi:hypothetical protein
METNPRARIQPEWAPPPPVVPGIPETPPPLPPAPEAEFEDILGSLVEHYSALPPPAYGEPPTENTATTRAPRSGLGPLLWASGGLGVVAGTVGALFLSGVLNLGMLGLGGQGEEQQQVRPAPVVAQPEVKIRINKPKVEPLQDPRAEPLDEPPAVPAAVARATQEPPKATLKVKPKRKRPDVAKRPRRARVKGAKLEVRPVAASDSDWTDPYQ